MSYGRRFDLPRGFHDTDTDRMAHYRALQQEWFTACGLAGYQPVLVPPVGFTDTFTAGHHAAGEKLYRFPDRAGRDLTLVSDSLPALLRATHARAIPEQRLSYCCPIFRYERRSRRHFHHLGLMEVLDRPSSLAGQQRSTARLAEVIIRFLAPRRLSPTFTVTDPGLWHTIARTFEPSAPATSVVDSLRKLSPDQRPARLHEHHAPPDIVYLAELLAADPPMTDGSRGQLPASLPRAIHDRISTSHELAVAVRRHGADATVDLGELHASEFHDGPSFLLRPRGEQRLLGDGGSYGLFATEFLGTPATVHSAVVGLERLADLIATSKNTRPAADVAVIAQPQQTTLAHADQLAASLRSAGIAVWDILLTKPLRQHLRDLATLAIPHSLIIGANELESDHYTVRTSDGVLHTVAQRRLARWLLDHRPDTADAPVLRHNTNVSSGTC